jgi:hypothetical protein
MSVSIRAFTTGRASGFTRMASRSILQNTSIDLSLIVVDTAPPSGIFLWQFLTPNLRHVLFPPLDPSLLKRLDDLLMGSLGVVGFDVGVGTSGDLDGGRKSEVS